MEIWRAKNVDTRIVFPIVDADGDPTSHADDNTPDSEWLSWDSADHGGAAPSFADCTHEYVEVAGGQYYLDVQGSEINKEFTLIQCKTALSGCKTQTILIRTYVAGDAYSSHIADQVHDEALSGHTTAGSAGKAISDIQTDVAAVHVHAGTIDGHITADYGSTEKTAIDMLDDADGGIGDVHTVTNAIKAKTDMLPAVWYSV